MPSTEAGKRLLDVFPPDLSEPTFDLAAAIKAVEAEARDMLSPVVSVTREEDGSWSVEIAAMPGHIGAAMTIPEAAAEAHDAALAWLEAHHAGRSAPPLRPAGDREMTDTRARDALAAALRGPDGLPEPIGRIRRRWWRLGWLSGNAVNLDAILAYPFTPDQRRALAAHFDDGLREAAQAVIRVGDSGPVSTGSTSAAPWCGICQGWHVPGHGPCRATYS